MTRRRARAAGLVAAALVAVSASIALPVDAGQAATAHPGSAVTVSVPISRVDRVAGVDKVLESSTFSLMVGQTALLRDRQEVAVSWKGAHPTGGIVADQNSSSARAEEYPVVLLQCRGLDSSSVPSAQRLLPETCWTASSAERYAETYNTLFPAWRLDRFGAPAQRKAVVGAPASVPKSCFAFAPAQYWLPFVAADRQSYAGGPNGCASMAPEAANVDGAALPSNTTYGVTAKDGRGQANFDMWTDESNASLGCSSTVRCSLVAVPILGLSCDVAATDLPVADRAPAAVAAASEKACAATGAYAPGEGASANASKQDLAVTGALWWSASNWRNRVTVPLTFAPSASVCDVVSTTSPVDLYGSELLTQATQRWAPAFCTNRALFRFRHVLTGEPEARTILRGGSVDAALVTSVGDPAYGRPVVQAPVAVTGFSVGYSIDTVSGTEYRKLKLTPRLLAKLITQSYPAILDVQRTYAALSHNPLNITLDPEFQALNPAITHGVAASEAASTLVLTSSDSDVIWALTSYIAADPEAKAWLSGTADPWGMVVNPNYRDIALPVTSWPLRDTFQPTALYQAGQNDCLLNNPVPYLPLVAAPVAHFADITEALQFSLANSTTVCRQQADGVSEGERLVPQGRQRIGFRFMIGVLPLADAARYAVDSAALQTRVASGSGSAFTSAAGRTFVAPTPASLRAAAHLLVPDQGHGAWRFPYSALGSAAGAAAYPGLEVVYAAVPTSGLSRTVATRLAIFLRYATTTGQVPGLENGRLPDGYLPLTAANGLGELASYSARAASAVAAQQGDVPPLVPAPVPPVTTPASSGDGTGSTGGDPAGVPAGTPAPTTSTPASVTVPTPAPSVALVASRTPLDVVSPAGLVVPGLLAAIAFGLVAASVAAFRVLR